MWSLIASYSQLHNCHNLSHSSIPTIFLKSTNVFLHLSPPVPSPTTEHLDAHKLFFHAHKLSKGYFFCKFEYILLLILVFFSYSFDTETIESWRKQKLVYVGGISNYNFSRRGAYGVTKNFWLECC